MPISSLPVSTLRAITSTLVLNDVVTVVKELVDNALDAKASTIAIEISANTLDVIQVKDNGFGIGVEDRQLVCKRGCTSKITTIDDLEQLGGSSLGFRGEALASVADLSDSVTLTTRVDGELAGSSLKYGPAGALLSCSSASHPVGSTIRVKDFLKIIPVRRQTALKNAAKALSALRKLLQGYAFARGAVRFSLKVLKGKNEKANWSYTPVDSAEKLRDIAARIVGKDVAGGCQIKTKDDSKGGEEGEKYSAIALLANFDSDAAKFNGTGQYISLDGRPVNAARGTIKEVVKLYRHYIRNGASVAQDLPASFDPLLVMHISCPRGSYDVNVEPMKDEVMFIKPESILSLVKSLFKDHYGEPSGSSNATNPIHKANTTPETTSSFSLLLAKRPGSLTESTNEPAQTFRESGLGSLSPQLLAKAPLCNSRPEMEIEDSISPPTGSRKSFESSEDDRYMNAVPPRAHVNMHGFYEDDEMLSKCPSLQDADTSPEDVGVVVARNPWSLAKLNAPVRRQFEIDESSRLPTHTSSISSQLDDFTSLSTPRAGAHRQPLGLRAQLPSPATSPHAPGIFQNPGPPKRPWPSRQRREDLSSSSRSEIPATPSTDSRQGVSKPLDTWVNPVEHRTELPSFRQTSELYDKNGRFESARKDDPPDLSQSPLQTSPTVEYHGHPQRTALLGRPFKSPLLQIRASSSADNGACSLPIPRALSASQLPSFRHPQSQNPELTQIMEFEHRKKAAHAQQRKLYGNARGRELNVAELAQLQQSSMQMQDDSTGSSMKVGFQDDGNGFASQVSAAVASFADRFDNVTTNFNLPTKASPHQNRYLAAAKRLTRAQPDEFDDGIHASDTRGLTEITDEGDDIPKIPQDDPRAYLIRHRSETANANAGGLSRTGLKIRRTKTQRLPLEAIPPAMKLHDIIARVDFNVQLYTATDPGTDRYNTTGKNDFIAWSASMTDIQKWQDRLMTLVESEYRAKVGGELISANVEVDLRKMVKAHCDKT